MSDQRIIDMLNLEEHSLIDPEGIDYSSIRTGEEFVEMWFPQAESTLTGSVRLPAGGSPVNTIPGGRRAKGCYPQLRVFVGRRDDISLRFLQLFRHVTQCDGRNNLVVLHVAKQWDPLLWHSYAEEFSWLCNRFKCRIFRKMIGESAMKLAP